MTLDKDPLWYKDAIIYQLHVKAFADSNNDGIGDFKGLTSKLDYIQDLGINTLWLLPFYPSPQKDDGYDIADYWDVHPNFGTLDDFKEFVAEAHKRDLRVITELVINHTSDQHPWFQAARNAPKGSPERDFYVWNDDDKKWPETRIIFSDTETSNWAWDPVAEQYYWHRFFSHQPDLNFDNPKVLQAVIDAMYYWLDMGVDGLRLDAIPYLVERDGTSNENNPETHVVIKKIRAALDERYPDRFLLAEANMWPEDVQPYFGDGDECHMAFHFPLMPRIYMAVAQEDRHPIVDIMRQTPDIPENCQWATFLRNHDELTLEMVTDRERDYMWNFYASDKRARINFGIRRRLAPLMENDRRRIELLNSLLMSMPGTPTLYYGDEIGMGDNIFLGDRNGVRTPMQWTPDRNGGFSLADPNYLYLPAIQDPIYGFQSLNVEAQRRTRSSLLNWMRSLIAAVKTTQAFSRGSLRFINHANRKVIAYIREFDGQKILCVANLSRAPQPCELDLREYNGMRPTEMLGHSIFPKIGELPYFLTLPAYGFFWFTLTDEEASKIEDELVPDLMTLVIPKGWDSIMTGAVKESLERHVLPAALMSERWYGAKAAGSPQVEIAHRFELASGRQLVLLKATPPNGEPRFCFEVWNIAWESMTDDPTARYQRCALARVRKTARVGLLVEASHEDEFARELIGHFRATSQQSTKATSDAKVTLRYLPTESWPDEDFATAEVTSTSGEQSNTSILIGDDMMLKLIRQPQPGMNPEAEIGRFLTEDSPFANMPKLYGTLEVVGLSDQPMTIAVVQELVPNQGDGWKTTLEFLSRHLEEESLRDEKEVAQETPEDRNGYYNSLARQLGVRTAEMHRALAKKTGNPDFDAEPITDADRKAWVGSVKALMEKAFSALDNRDRFDKSTHALVDRALSKRDAILRQVEALLPATIASQKTRLHGDYHLGQVLLSKNDYYLIDFEGEPARPLAERRQKLSPLKDVAGMLRSFDYAAASALKQLPPTLADKHEQLSSILREWREEAIASFCAGYAETRGAIDAEAEALLRFHLIEKACYEILYEAQNRPQWLDIPLTGLLSLTEENSQ